MQIKIKLTIISLTILSIATVAVAQPDYERWGREQIVATAVVDIWVRSSEPAGLFCSRGKKLGVIKTGQKVKVKKYINAKCGLLFKYDYLEIEVLNPTSKQPPWGIVSAVNDDGSPLFIDGTVQ